MSDSNRFEPTTAVVGRLFWLGLVPAMTLPLFGSLLYFVVLSDHPAGRTIYSGVKVFTVAWPVVCVCWLWRKEFAGSGWTMGAIGNWRHHVQALPLGIASGLVIVGTMWALLQTPLGAIVDASAPRIHAKADSLGFLEHYIAFAAFLSVLHSLIEEYFWRWFVFGHLRERLAPMKAGILGSLAFAAHHFVVTAQFFPLGFAAFLGVCVAIGGGLWCWHYQTQRSLAGALDQPSHR